MCSRLPQNAFEIRQFYVVVMQRRQTGNSKNRDASAKLLFYQSDTITFFPFLLPSRRHRCLIVLLSLQAAIGSVSLDMARERGFTGMLQEELGIQVITVYNHLLVTLFVLAYVQ